MGNIWRQPADVLTGKSGTKIIYIEICIRGVRKCERKLVYYNVVMTDRAEVAKCGAITSC